MNYATLEAHPLAETFRLMNDQERESLEASIREDGIRESIWLYEGKILDGRNRYAAAKEVSYKLKETDFRQFSGTMAEAEAFVISTNASRRQMSGADKKALIELMLARDANKTDRHIARLCGVSHVTVAKYRAPPKDKALDAFVEHWKELNNDRRKLFVEKFKAELRELWTD
jgi:ParB-like chromosome segregation protein Spo0J